MKLSVGTLSLYIISLVFTASINADTTQSYTDYRNNVIELPAGSASFVDRVVGRKKGKMKVKKKEDNPNNALGEPDYRKPGDGHAFTLGCKGQATFEFTDNALIDVAGIDFYIFEVGKDVEPMRVDLSNNGKNWLSIGKISGGKVGIDIADYNLKQQNFRFVRITDLGKFCSGEWPGADVDAIAAVGSAVRLQLSSTVLFDTGKFEFKEDGNSALKELVDQLKKLDVSKLIIIGHTDSKGSNSSNQALSKQRAKTVKEHILNVLPHLTNKTEFKGRGESEPIASNSTEQGRQKNRRVELIVRQK